ncbi:protein FAM178B-like isoform X1 [Petromyzon marinus]|uniref:protein FAM178B-like isoform X1 n=1 Tax=Petromyzon marinus TaxID=7757 RepID=UPI003F6E77B5
MEPRARGTKRKRREAGSRLRSPCLSPPHRSQPITNFFKPKPLSDLGGASLPTEVPAPEKVMLPSIQLGPCVNAMDPIVFLGPRIRAPSGGAGDGAGGGGRSCSGDGPGAGGGSGGVSGAVDRAVSGGVSRVVSRPMSYKPVLVLEKLQEDEVLFHTCSSSKLALDVSSGGRNKRRASGATKSDDDGSGERRAGRTNRLQSSFDHCDGGGGGNDADDDDEEEELPSLRTRTVQQATRLSPETPIMERLRAIAQQRERTQSEGAVLPRALHWQPHTSDEEDEGEMDEEGVSERQLQEVPNLPSSLQHVLQAHMGPVYSVPDHPPGEVLLGPPCASCGAPFSSAPLRLDGLSDEPLGTMLRSGAGLLELVELVQSRLSPVQWEQQWLFRVVVRVDRDVEADMARAALWKICSRSRGRPVWVPSLLEFFWALAMLGIPYSAIFPHPHFTVGELLHCSTLSADAAAPLAASLAAPMAAPLPAQAGTANHSQLLRLSMLLQVLAGCLSSCPSAYSDRELSLLILAIGRLNLDPALRPLTSDLQQLLHVALGGVRCWAEQMPPLLCLLSQLSSHHHNLLSLVQMLPSYEPCCRQLQRCLCLAVIGQLLKEPRLSFAHSEEGSKDEVEVSLLLPFLPRMMWSSLVRLLHTEEGELGDITRSEGGNSGNQLKRDMEACYLSCSLLTLADVYVGVQRLSQAQRKPLMKLVELLRRVQNDVRDSPQRLYRSKLKNLILRIECRWQDILGCMQPTQGNLFNFWNPYELSDEEVWSNEEFDEEKKEMKK